MRISDWSSDVCSSDLLLAQPVQCEFGCVACTREHRLAEEDAAQRDAVQSPDQLPVPPYCNAMGLTTIELFHVDVANVLAQPGAVAPDGLTTPSKTDWRRDGKERFNQCMTRRIT